MILHSAMERIFQNHPVSFMGTGFLLLYKRFEDGRMSWPRTTQEAAELTEEQFHYLMLGLNPLNPKIKDVNPEKIC